MKKSKFLLSTIGIFLTLCCLLVSVWWIVILLVGPDKEVDNTIHLGSLSTIDGSQSEYLIDVKYSANDNGAGAECLDVRFNSFVDENQNAIYSNGIQIVGDELKFKTKYVDSSATGVVSGSTFKAYHNAWATFDVGEDSVYYYQSADGFTTTFSGEESFANDGFKLTLQNAEGEEELYKLKFRGYDVNQSLNIGQSYKYNNFMRKHYYNYYYASDVMYLANYLYESCQSLANGTHGITMLNLPDIFSLWKYDGNVYVELDSVETSKVKNTWSTYCVFKIEKTAEGVMTANDSLFGAVKNSSQFNLYPEFVDNTYFAGETVYQLFVCDFDYVPVFEDYVVLKLDSDLRNALMPYSKDVKLSIRINVFDLSDFGFRFYGFAVDHGLDGFDILECYLYEGEDEFGNQIRTEVEVC